MNIGLNAYKKSFSGKAKDNFDKGWDLIFKNEDKVSGVTSAAFIWLTAAIGVIVGIGYILTPIVFTVGLLIVLLILQRVEDKIENIVKKKDEN
jgi:putative Mg2+ transporter-C (MgtC) family protein